MAILLSLWGLVAAPAPPPEVRDGRVLVELFAQEPAIVTPTGIAIDRGNRLYAIESNTHFRPPGYEGPPKDRILTWDLDQTEAGGSPQVYFEGSEATMNLAVAPDGSIYVATRMEVFRLRDRDGDGKAEERTAIAHLETAGDYPHNGLSGFAFDAAGRVYFGMGENLGARYTLHGSDGSTHMGGGEGGNLFRANAQGGEVTRVATGFWNPFHLCFDPFERLFAVDNDPDSRPPCRLLEIVPGGDYGYRYRNGRKGLHPFTAWNGELPGTLPMTAGTGEAPSGILAYDSDQLPSEYVGTVLGTSWGDHRIEVYRLRDAGAGLRADRATLVQGGEDFRPVGIALAPDGSVYFTDWVKRDYHLHRHGRIWRLRSKNAARRVRASDPLQAVSSAHGPDRQWAARALAASNEAVKRDALLHATRHENERVRSGALRALAARGPLPSDIARAALADRDPRIRALAGRILRGANGSLPSDVARSLENLWEDGAHAVRAELLRTARPQDRAQVLAAIGSSDPFLRQAALRGATRLLDGAALASLLARPEGLGSHRESSARARREIVVALRERRDAAGQSMLADLLHDDDPLVRFAAVQWIAEARRKEHRPQVEEVLSRPETSAELFEACLVALEMLDRDSAASPIDGLGSSEYVARLLTGRRLPENVWARALRLVRPDHPSLTIELLRGYLASPDKTLRREAVRTLRDRANEDRLPLLESIARDPAQPAELRADAIVGLAPDSAQRTQLLVSLAAGDEPSLRREALRSLRGANLSDEELEKLKGVAIDPQDRELLWRLAPSPPGEEFTKEQVDRWLERLAGPADAAAGERIFFHPKGPRCYVCHSLDGRGGRIGPDLAAVGAATDRRRLIESIVDPDREVAPQFATWIVARKDGSILRGVFVGESADAVQTYADAKGTLHRVPSVDVEARSEDRASVMPAELPREMTTQEFRDLLAFLQSARRPAPPSPAETESTTR